MALALDAASVTSASASGSLKTASATFTTAQNNEYVAVFIQVESSGLTMSDGTNTYNSRASGTETRTLYYYYATVATAGTYTITFNWTTGSGYSYLVFGIEGANVSSPFDPDFSSAVVTSNGTAATSATTNTFSTANANDFLFTVMGMNATVSTPSSFAVSTSNYTLVIAAASAPNTAAYDNGAYDVVSSTQSSVSVHFTWTTTSRTSVMITDAIVAATVAATHTGNFLMFM